MNVFFPTLNQMGFLFTLIIAGFILAKSGAVPDSAAGILAKLENNLFIPALVLSTFLENFTVEKLSTSLYTLCISAVVLVFVIPLSFPLSRLCAKDTFTKNLYIYGLCFANFGFMGNAVVKEVFPDHFLQYIIFTLPLWVAIYTWGAPNLLIPRENAEKKSFAARLKPLLTPMFLAIPIGMALGLLGVRLPAFFKSAIDVSSSCMSPVAMLLTGITVAKLDFRKTFSSPGIYIASLLRLIFLPALFIGIFAALRYFGFPYLSDEIIICAVCTLAMPLGLNTIVIPSAYGKDTSAATGMAVVSHLLSCATIPLVFLAMTKIFGI